MTETYMVTRANIRYLVLYKKVCQPMLLMIGIKQCVQHQKKGERENCQVITREHFEIQPYHQLSSYKYLHLMQTCSFSSPLLWATKLSHFGHREKEKKKTAEMWATYEFKQVLKKNKRTQTCLLLHSHLFFLQPGHYFKVEHVLAKILWFKVVPAIIPLVWGV